MVRLRVAEEERKKGAELLISLVTFGVLETRTKEQVPKERPT